VSRGGAGGGWDAHTQRHATDIKYSQSREMRKFSNLSLRRLGSSTVLTIDAFWIILNSMGSNAQHTSVLVPALTYISGISLPHSS
jgi:hypothetical protein